MAHLPLSTNQTRSGQTTEACGVRQPWPGQWLSGQVEGEEGVAGEAAGLRAGRGSGRWPGAAPCRSPGASSSPTAGSPSSSTSPMRTPSIACAPAGRPPEGEGRRPPKADGSPLHPPPTNTLRPSVWKCIKASTLPHWRRRAEKNRKKLQHFRAWP